MIQDVLKNWQLDKSEDGEVEIKDDSEICSLGNRLDEGMVYSERVSGKRVYVDSGQ